MGVTDFIGNWRVAPPYKRGGWGGSTLKRNIGDFLIIAVYCIVGNVRRDLFYELLYNKVVMSSF